MREHHLIGDQTAISRFQSFIQKTDDCWEWSGTKTKGYGTFHAVIDGVRRSLKAHRVSVALYTGKAVPEHLDVMHACDNPSCVNPRHLSVGTRLDNMQDAAAKSRICTVGKSRQAFCKNGHPLSGGNVYLTTQGHRRCRECTLSQQRSKYFRDNPDITPRGPRCQAIRGEA